MNTKGITTSSLRSLIHIFLFRLYSYLINSFTMLTTCLRALTSERERKTKHRTRIQNFREQGPRSSVGFPARADPMGLQKCWLHQKYARAWNRTLERKACQNCSHARALITQLERTSSLQKVLGARISRSSVRFPAQADLKILENPELCSWAPIRFSTNKTCMLWLKSQI